MYIKFLRHLKLSTLRTTAFYKDTLYTVPIEYIYVLCVARGTAIIFPNSTNSLIFITETVSVYCAVQTKYSGTRT
jgi:hypothetical protein